MPLTMGLSVGGGFCVAFLGSRCVGFWCLLGVL